MFIHESLSSVRQTHPAIELLLVDLKTKRSRLSCGLYYWPPSADPSDLASLETALEELPPLCVNSFLLMGDLNINLLSSSHQPILQSIVDKLGLTQIVSAPTRVTQNTSTLIDHAYFSENLSKVNRSVQPPVDGSDHNSILLTVKSILPARGSDRRRKVWLCSQADFDSANQTLQCLSSRSFPANDVDTLWTQWYDFFMTTISQSIPSKIVKPRHKLPYLTDNLQRALKRKLKLFQEAKKLDTERAWSKYSKARNKATTTLRSAMSNFFKSLSTRLKSPKDFWAIYHKLSPKDGIPTDLKLDNTTARTSRAKANLLNNFFFIMLQSQQQAKCP